MDRRRRLAIIVILVFGVLLIGAVIAYLFFGGGLVALGLAQATETPIPPPTATPLPDGVASPTPSFTAVPDVEFVEVVVSLQTIQQERGYQMTEAEVAIELRLASEVDSNVITDINDVIGKFTRRKIYQGETLTHDAFVDDLTQVGREEYGPSSLIPQGFVAMAVPVDRLGSVGYGVEAGDSIDILVSFILLPVDEQFQTRLPNKATFYIVTQEDVVDEVTGETVTRTIRKPYTITPYGRFEALPTGDTAFVQPSEELARGTHIAFVIQNARVIEVGPWIPPSPALVPTATPNPESEEGEQGPSEEEVSLDQLAGRIQQVLDGLAGPPYNNTILVALPPQQQVFLKYAVETQSVIDFALRANNDNQFYPVENISLDYVLERFNVEIPPNFTYVVDTDGFIFDGYQSEEQLTILEIQEGQGATIDAEAGVEDDASAGGQ